MKRRAALAELRNLQKRADMLREKLGVSRAGEVTFLASCGGATDDTVIVEADGLGGATARIVVGNYPVDYITKFEKFFADEDRAATAAVEIAFNGAPPGEPPGAPT